MRVAILQPHFLPFIGYFDLMNRADVFVYYDTVQFVRRSWHCRTYIKERGVARWLSAPSRTRDGSRRALSEIEWADDQPWRSKIARRLEHCYAHTTEPYALREITELIRSGPPKLSDWNIEANALLSAQLGVTTQTIRASQLPPISGDKEDRIIRLCLELGATHYVCGPGSRAYIRDEDFAKFDIAIEWMAYDYEYRVPTTDGLKVFPSALDLILSQGGEAARDAIIGA